jgi:hypothetical protein
MRLSFLATLFWAVAGGAFVAVPLHAQGYPFSQRGSVSQMVAFTEFTVAYGRPIARGRVLFGDTGVVKWNQTWNPGADSATRISISRAIELEGKPLPAGEYSIWLVPRATGNWTFILSRAAHVFHTPYPGEAQDALRVEVTPERLSHMETLAIYFPMVMRENAIMRIHWGETAIPLRISAPGGGTMHVAR